MRTARASIAVATLAAVVGCQPKQEDAPPVASAATSAGRSGARVKIAMIPKKKGLAYFEACQKGGEEAARELGDVEFKFEGPIEDKSEEQSRLLRNYSTLQYDAISVACNDADQIAPAMASARDAGTHVLTFDADANPTSSKREFFLNQATVDAIAQVLTEEMVEQVGQQVDVAVLSSTQTASNQVAWLKSMEAYRLSKYPALKVVVTEYGAEDQNLCIQKAQAILNGYPNVKGIWAMSSVAFPGAAQAVEQAGKSGQVAVVGLSTPKDMAQFVKSGVVKTVILWNPVDLGYLTVHAARAVANGDLKPGATSFDAGRLGKKQVQGDQILLGDPMKFTKENIDRFDF